MKKMMKLLGISSLLLLLVLPSMAMAEIHIDWYGPNGMSVTDDDSYFIFEAGHMRLNFGDGYIEIWFDPSFMYGVPAEQGSFVWVDGNGHLISWLIPGN